MNNVTTHKKLLVPQLRFKEFDGEWNKKAINSFASKLKVGFVGTCEPYYTDKVDGVLLVRTGNLKGVNIELDEEKYVTKEFHTKNLKSQIKPNDLLLARHGGNGEICRVPFDFPIANCLNIVILRTNSAVDTAYFQMVYSTFLVQSQIAAVTAGSTQVVINTKEIGKLKVCFPNLPEQQKIATFLTAVDQKIQQLSSKKEQLEKYKKGAMQQLFSQELRFKDDDGNDFADWEESGLGKYIDLFSGYAFKGEDITDDEKGIPLLRGINITEGYIRHNKEIDRFFKNEIKNIDKLRVQIDDLVLSMDGSKVGKNSALVTKFDEGALLVQRVARIRSLATSDIQFIYQHIRSSQFIRYVDMVNTSSGIPHISSKQIKDFKIKFPCVEEQQKIAAYLSSLDAKIEKVGTQIKNTQEFKKGLLQQLFV
jgi:type I restriction enzyme S subunit